MGRATYVLCLILVVLAGCARIHTKKSVNYRTVESSETADVTKARRKHKHAIHWMETGHYVKAEQALHEALIADVNFGPAHNTLGKLYFDQRKFYLSAWEFEHASKSMPFRPEPHNNLGLVYESVGQTDRAIESYQQAFEIAPDNPEFLGNLVRARIRRDDTTSDLRDLLEQLILLEERPEWLAWARRQLALDRIDEEYIESEIIYDGPAEFEGIENLEEIVPSTSGMLKPALLPGVHEVIGDADRE